MSSFAKLAQEPPKLKRESVDIPEWGGTFYIVEISGKVFEEVTAAVPMGDMEKMPISVAASVLSRCLLDDEGQSPTEDWLKSQSAALLGRIAKEAMRLNGFSSEAAADLEKN